jgi:hypothetical protein
LKKNIKKKDNFKKKNEKTKKIIEKACGEWKK